MLQRGAVPFEWYSEWAQLRPLLRAAVGADGQGDAAATADVPAGGRVLVVGGGNSELSAQRYDDGFVDSTNIDFSKACAPCHSRFTPNKRTHPSRRAADALRRGAGVHRQHDGQARA